MFYTHDYVLDKLKQNLQELNIFVKKDNEKIFYILEYKGHKAKIDLDNFLVRLDDNQSTKSDKLLSDFLFNIEQNLLAQSSFNINDFSKETILKKSYPVLRATTFGKNAKENFVTKEHTNETKIFYSVDLGNSYKLLTEQLLKDFDISHKELENHSVANLQKLPLTYNMDEVAGNKFYFLNAKDGYDGSRLLNEEVLKYFYKKIGGEYYLGIPHQDTLVIADIKNKQGLEILQKIMVHFFTEGRVPITTITFKYDNKKLESLFIFVE